MGPIILFGSVVATVSLLSFLCARRFGALALSLAAGSVLAGLWSEWLAKVLSSFGISLPWLPTGVLVTIILLLAPMLVLLLSGPKYHGRSGRIISALAIGLLTAAFLVQPLGKFLVLEGDALAAYQWLAGMWQYVVTVGLVLGVADLSLSHSKKSAKKH